MTSIANDGRGFRSWQIGKVSVTRIDEQRFSTAASDMLAGTTDEQIDRNRWLRPHFMEDDGRLKMSIGFVA